MAISKRVQLKFYTKKQIDYHKKYNKKRRENNKEKFKEYNKKYYEDNREKKLIYRKEYYEIHKKNHKIITCNK